MSSAMLAALGLAMGMSYASGLRLYATVAVLGLLHRIGVVHLPASLSILGNPIVIAIALALYALEFFADKIPYVGSVWNAIHTFIRPPAAALLSYAALSPAPSEWRILGALLGGGVAFSSHSIKTALRTPLEASPEPFSTSAFSLAEDGLAGAVAWLAVAHPILTLVVVVALFAATLYLTVRLYRAFRSMFGRFIRAFRGVRPAVKA
ncbi:MAG TPA: DUF4126 domain-containing protein [Terriglobia bacterium]|nr:DUF4126 domain-containing protein [Terriglobia bacterium]